MYPSEADFLQRMFYETIFVPKGENALPLSIVHHTALQKYTYDREKPDDLAFLAEMNKKRIGMIRSHFQPNFFPVWKLNFILCLLAITFANLF